MSGIMVLVSLWPGTSIESSVVGDIHRGLLFVTSAFTLALGTSGTGALNGYYQYHQDTTAGRVFRGILVGAPSFAGGMGVALVANALPQSVLNAI